MAVATVTPLSVAYRALVAKNGGVVVDVSGEEKTEELVKSEEADL